MDEATNITRELANVNLDDPYHWIVAFQDELGVSSSSKLVGGDAYPNLVRYAKHSWEKKALRKLLDIREEVYEVPYQEQSEIFLEKMQERYREACEIYGKLKKLNSEGNAVDRSDKRVKENEKAIREKLFVTPNAWIPDDVSFQGLINEIQHMIEQMDSLLQNRSCHDVGTLLQTASNGRALQGIMLSKNIEEQLKPRDQLISVPKNGHLVIASNPQIDVIEKFKNEQEENKFVRSIEVLGYSAVAPSKVGGLWGVCVDTSIALGKFNEKLGESRLEEAAADQEGLYLSTVRYFTVPLASFAFSDTDLQLTDNALSALKQIAMEISSSGPESTETKEKCKTFFHRFGSHVRRGPMLFGGAYWQKCSSKVFQSAEMLPLEEIQSKAVKRTFTDSTQSLSEKTENPNNLSWENWIATQNEMCSETTISQTHLETKKIGGDSKATNLSVWRAGLVASNHQWSLVDCGTILVPVWEIIQLSVNHTKLSDSRIQLESVVEVAGVLQRQWETMQENEQLPITLETTIIFQLSQWIQDEVTKWNPNENQPSAKDGVQTLVQIKEDLTKALMDPLAWPRLYLSQEPIQKYLQVILEQQQSQPSTLSGSTDSQIVHMLLQQLIHRSDLNAAHGMNNTLRCQLSSWLYKVPSVNHGLQKFLPIRMESEDFKNFRSYLKQGIKILENVLKSGKENLQCYITVLTAAITRAINHFRQNFYLSMQKYEDLYVTTVVYPFTSKCSTNSNQAMLALNHLSQEDLQFMCDQLDKGDDLCQILASKNTAKAQTFIFHLTIDMYLSGSQDIAQHQVFNHLLFLRKEIGGELETSVYEILCKNLPGFHIMDSLLQHVTSNQIDEIISKHIPNIGASSNWTTLETDLSAVSKFVLYADGFSIDKILQQGSSQNTTIISNSDSDDEYMTCDEGSDSEIVMTVSHHHTSELKIETDPSITELFKVLDLLHPWSQNHSRTITLRDALSIKKETLDTTKCYDPQKLHIFLMQKIMAYDYRCRDNQLSTPPKSRAKKKHEPTESDKDSQKDSSGYIKEDEPQEGSQNDSSDKEAEPQEGSQNDSSDEPQEDSQDDSSESESDNEDNESKIKIHPMDALLALLHCADDFLRQDLNARLVACKLSIPLILPDPFTGKLVFPLWAMRSIVKEWQSSTKGNAKFHECPLVSYPTPIISFVRFGKQEKSKSKIMNNIISVANHGHFFHRDCEGGSLQRVLGNGLIEICWYLPAGKKDDDIFPDLIAFCNLHGNALEHPQQIAFLSEISFMTLVLITKEDFNENSTEVLQQLSKTPGGMVLCTTSEQKSLEDLVQKNGIPAKAYRIITLKDKNEDEIKKSLQGRINRGLKKSKGKMFDKKLEDCVDSALKYGIAVDELKEELQKSQEQAKYIQKLVIDHEKSESHQSPKEDMLPLQGKELWHEWAIQDKEEHRQIFRGDEGMEKYAAQKLEKKNSIRQRQLACAKNLSPLMGHFIVTLMNTKGDQRRYFLQCIKLYLDDLSRTSISSLQQEHKAQRKSLKSIQRDNKGSDQLETLLDDCRRKIEQLHKEIVDASLGLEHLLRELGQVYEAIQESSLGTNILYRQLPKLAAELLIDGYPLELMDGDAAHVPLEWVTAVLKEAANLLKIDSKEPLVYVLSVLGLQSTGKSTLINTTFGLQFNVGAGRCTRGAFMQLLPISDELREEAKCDYVLVVDTEGLRAPELDFQKMQKHDNELATFVIGVANETIVNIFGEVPGDLDDILQTTVHAFIRMKRVKFSPSCQFVHQNVGGVAASDKGGMGRSKFTDKLDKMTQEAAKEEKREDEFKDFSDVIHFEEEQDVHHFPTLWNGTPPMAHVNPVYSDKALCLRSHIVHRIIKSGNVKRLSTVQTHIKDLWTALLHEKFVFSFRNTMEIAVYNSLDAKFGQWSWRFRSEMLEWERSAENEIKNSEGLEQLQQIKFRLLTEQLPTKVTELYTELEKEKKKFFEESEQSEMLAQWDVQTKNRLDRLKYDLQGHAEKLCDELIKSHQARADGEQMKVAYEEEVVKKVRQLIKEQPEEILMLKKGNTAEVEETLTRTFDKQWKGWMEDIRRKIHGPEYRQQKLHMNKEILSKVQKQLYEFYEKDDHLITERLKWKPLKEWGTTLYLHLEEQHVRINSKQRDWTQSVKKFLKDAKDVITRAPPKEIKVLKEEQNRKFALITTEYAFDRVRGYLEDLSRQKTSFNPTYTVELLIKLHTAIDERALTEQAVLHFTKQYRVDMSLIACGYAVRKFCDMAESFRQQHDPVVYLTREMKTPLFRLFKNTFLQSADEKIAACTLCDLLANSIDKQIPISLPAIIFKDMKTLQWAANKSALKAQMLLDLGEDLQKPDSNLNNYFLHLHKDHYQESLKMWLGKYTRKHCEKKVVYVMEKWCKKEEKLKQKIRTQLVILAIHELERLVQLVQEEAHEATSKSITKKKTKGDQSIIVKEWLDLFISEKLTKEITVKELRKFHTYCDIKELRDIENFEQEIKSGLRVLQKRLKKKFKKLVILIAKPAQDSEEIYILESDVIEHLYKQLCGCTEQCPFCGEQCDCTDDQHEGIKHSVVQHRSTCLAKYREVWSGELVPDVCNSLVTGDKRFGNNDTNGEYRPYKEYQTTYPNWSIPPDTSAKTALYWKWFLGRYSGRVALEFGARDNKIPQEWRVYTWEQAKEQLKKDYNI